ncbi:hypothetical protein DFQ28_000042 [Apophysomyces sp. BC1034]|nr:hypothetical protein DFQ28_000042 [Apophysomyces sp. BC1034]
MEFQWFAPIPNDENEIDASAFFLDPVNVNEAIRTNSVPMPTNDGNNDIVQFLFQSPQSFPAVRPIVQQQEQDITAADMFNPTFSSDSSSGGLEETNLDTFPITNTTTETVSSDSSASVQENTAIQQWVTSVIAPVSRTQPQNKATMRRPIGRKNREPIFVTESPQNIYKKKRSKNIREEDKENPPSTGPLSSSSYDDDETDDIGEGVYSTNLKQMSSKERRQLRNKISAQYLGQLEARIEELEEENKQLRKTNEEIMLKLQHWEQTSNTAAVTPPTSSDGHLPEPVSIMPFDLDNLYDMEFFDVGANTYHLSHATIPDWNFVSLLTEASKDVAESQLLRLYPLFAPAIMSIVLQHTFKLHYEAYLMNLFPYNHTSMVVRRKSKSKSNLLDLLNPEDFAAAVGDTTPAGTAEEKGASSTDPCQAVNETGHGSASASYDTTEDEDEMSKEELCELLLTKCYKYYTFMRLRGLSHDEIIARCEVCIREKRQRERQKALHINTPSHRLRSMAAFCSVAGSLLRHPDRMPQVWKVMKNNSAINPQAQIAGPQPAVCRIASFRQPLRALRISRH